MWKRRWFKEEIEMKGNRKISRDVFPKISEL